MTVCIFNVGRVLDECWTSVERVFLDCVFSTNKLSMDDHLCALDASNVSTCTLIFFKTSPQFVDKHSLDERHQTVNEVFFATKLT